MSLAKEENMKTKLLLIAILLTGCGTDEMNRDTYGRLAPGDSMREVEWTLGEPDRIEDGKWYWEGNLDVCAERRWSCWVEFNSDDQLVAQWDIDPQFLTLQDWN